MHLTESHFLDDAQSGHQSRVYRNDDGVFSDIFAQIPGVAYSSAAWGDYDNDGDLDIVLTGEYIRETSRVCQNESGSFVDIGPKAGLTGVDNSSVAWGDYDNDGDLDILLAGECPRYISRVYRNNSEIGNSPPLPPGDLQSQIAGNELELSWGFGIDPETHHLGLIYNLRVGTTTGGSEIVSAMAGANGSRRVVELGNVNHNRTWTITLPEPLEQQYYWSVQTLDTAFEGSVFAPEATTVAAGVGDSDEAPTHFAFYPSASNPFSTETVLSFDLPDAVGARIVISDVRGRRVKTLVDRFHVPGRHKVTWGGDDDRGRRVAPGVYFARLEAGDFVATHQLTVVE
jgi:hypothetical protein